jgi:uncharacterized protein YgfB (UPF0149 family)
MHRPEYDEIQDCLEGPAAGSASAEAHGTLCGLMCVAADDLPDSWIQNTLADTGAHPDRIAAGERDRLVALYQSTLEALAGTQFEFELLLPDDGVQLGLRADALGRWCQGFLYGLAVRGLKSFDELPEDLREILEDLSQITEAQFADGEGEEEGEKAYATLVEYVRVGVQLIYDEMNPPVVDARPAQFH